MLIACVLVTRVFFALAKRLLSAAPTVVLYSEALLPHVIAVSAASGSNAKGKTPVRLIVATVAIILASCAPLHPKNSDEGSSVKDAGGSFEPPNNDTMFASLYEVQIRAANACRNDVGSPQQRAACAAKLAPQYKYRAESWDYQDCSDHDAPGTLNNLEKIRLGTIEDMLEDTDDYHVGITLEYIKNKVGANTVWIMPVFPNNDRWKIPARCDNLGSPYAVRDYMHVAGSLSRVCIQANRTEFQTNDSDETPCFGNVSMDKLIEQAKQKGLRVMMDVALNHFGHNYRFYDYAQFQPTRNRIAANENLDKLWDMNATFEEALVHPELIDSIESLDKAALSNQDVKSARDAVVQKCPALKGDTLVRATGMWRSMLDWERAQFDCAQPMYLEFQVPGFYAGAGGWNDKHPARRLGDNFTNNWVDVKFLYHHEIHASDSRGDYYQTFVRNREYFFRILNYWVSRGVQGFRLDHTTDGDSGMSPNEWKYLTRKVNHYDWVRKGRPQDHHRPIYLAEEFGDQQGMNQVADAMTEGYVGDMRHGAEKNTAHVQEVLDRAQRFNDRTLIMRALETHDEHRLYEATGFDEWTGAGFWGIGATTRAVPMLLMGQEFGERYGLAFRRSDLLGARFYGLRDFAQGQDLVNFYGGMLKGRADGKNHALLSASHVYLPLKNNDANDPRLFAMMKWWGHDVVFVFHNLWEQGTVEQAFYIPPDAAAQAGIQGGNQYKLVNILSGQQVGACRSGDELKTNFYSKLEAKERLQWLRLEMCR